LSYMFPVVVDHEILAEYREELEYTHQEVERLAITLERSEFNTDLVNELRSIFHKLWVSSVKLDLVPFSESLNDTIKGLDLLLGWKVYPVQMSEFILLLIDRLLMLAKDVEHNFVIDMQKTQSFLVALQYIILKKDPEELPAGIEKAITAITREIYQNLDELNNESEVVLFDDDDDGAGVELFDDGVELFDDDGGGGVELFDDDGVELFDEAPIPEEQAEKHNVDLFLPNASLNPLAQAREYIDAHFKDHSFMVLARISDMATQHGGSHTEFLLELSLALNILAGNPIDVDGLFKGICLHDIALASLPHLLNKKGRLTREEFAQIRLHPIQGAELARQLHNSDIAELTILHHHERLDGTGYPYGLKGDTISEPGKLVAIVDSFHGMIDQRPHKQYTKSNLRAIAEINACVGTQYDKSWIKLFNTCMREFWLPEHKDKIPPVQHRTVA
jgi:HD-GYP domain-containing protein (c-di-GMP phosphodiesterase class II)